MSNQPKTPVSNFRIPPDVKTRAQANAEGRTLTDVVVEALEQYAPEPLQEEAQWAGVWTPGRGGGPNPDRRPPAAISLPT